MFRGKLISAALGVLAISMIAGRSNAAVYDAVAQWNHDSNTATDLWQYGTENTLGGPITLFTGNGSNATPAYNWWSLTGDFAGPTVGKNNSGSTQTFISPTDPHHFVWPADQLSVAPGSPEHDAPSYIVVRWMAPVSGVFDITGTVTDQQDASVVWYLQDNGTTEQTGSFPGTPAGLQGTQPFSLDHVSITAGTDIDFVVFSGGANQDDDIVGLTETITPASVPEPGSLSILGVAVLGLALRPSRRFRAAIAGFRKR